MSPRLVEQFNFHDIEIVHTNQAYVPPREIAPDIQTIWEQGKKQYGDSLWNGINYRLERIERDKNKIILYVGLTNYKANFASGRLVEQIQALPFSSRPNALSIGGFLVTSDGKYVIGQTPATSIHGERYEIFGGSLNQDEMEINKSDDIRAYLYKELEEEIGLTAEHVQLVEGLGIYETPTCRILIVMKVHLKQTAEEIQKLVRINHEHDRVLILNHAELLELHNEPRKLTSGIRFILQDFV